MRYDRIVNETVLRDIIDLAIDLHDRDELDYINDRQRKKSFSSITSKAKGLVMVFPVICSNYMSFEAAAMIAKATEKKAVVLLDLLFSAACITDVENAEDFVRQFHTNLNMGRMTMDDFHNMMDRMVDENGLITPGSIQEETYNKVMDDLKSMNFYFEENIYEGSISDYKYIPSKNNKNILIGVTEGLDLDVGNASRDTAQIAKNLSDFYKSDLDVDRNKIIDAEIKKANELAPTMMHINFIAKNAGGSSTVHSSAIVGVKAKLYVVDGEDIMNRLEIKHTDKNLMLRLVKVSSREIAFFKDFLFAIDRAKIDALAQSKRGSSHKMWRVLERRALKSKIRRSLSMANDATAISTLVITQEEVEYLKKTRYIDVENPRVICTIMDAYNLMGFVIVDEALEIAKFLYDDGEGEYEVITFNNLEREQRDNSKKIVNLMSKMSR